MSVVSLRHRAGRWRAYAAIGLVLAAGLSDEGKPAPAQSARSAQAWGLAANTSSNVSTAGPLSDGQAGGKRDAVTEYGAEDLSRKPIRVTDWIMALSAAGSAAFALVLAVLTWRLWIVGRQQHHAMMRSNVVSRRAIRHASDANRLSRDALIVDQRPWVVPELVIKDGITWDANEGRFNFVFKLNNIGKSPAFNVWVTAEIFYRFGDPRARYNQMAHDAKKRPPHWGYTIFPGHPFSQEYSVAVPVADVRAYFAEMQAQTGTAGVTTILPILLMVCDYTEPISEDRRQTGIILSIHRVPGSPSLAIGPDHGNQSAEELQMVAGLFGGGFIVS